MEHPLVASNEPEVVTTDAGLLELVDTLRAAGSFAFDTEFIGEQNYFPIFCLLQVATVDEAWLIDPLAGLDLLPLWELIADPAVTTLVHAGLQDLEPVERLTGRPPAAIYDTQIAAGFAGLDYPCSLRKLTDALTDADLGRTTSSPTGAAAAHRGQEGVRRQRRALPRAAARADRRAGGRDGSHAEGGRGEPAAVPPRLLRERPDDGPAQGPGHPRHLAADPRRARRHAPLAAGRVDAERRAGADVPRGPGAGRPRAVAAGGRRCAAKLQGRAPPRERALRRGDPRRLRGSRRRRTAAPREADPAAVGRGQGCARPALAEGPRLCRGRRHLARAAAEQEGADAAGLRGSRRPTPARLPPAPRLAGPVPAPVLGDLVTREG